MTDVHETIKKLEELLREMKDRSITPTKNKIAEEIETVLGVLQDASSSPLELEDARTRAELLIRSRPV